MYQCSNCGKTMSYPLDRCPGCGAILSGVRCQACKYVGAKSEFINNGHRCPKCNSIVYISGTRVQPPTPRATHSSTPVTIAASNKSPFLAALLSYFLLGGAGQIYLGQWKKGLALMISTFFLSFVFVGILIPIIGIGDAYGIAQKLNNGNSVGEWEFNINWKESGLVVITYAIAICGIVFLASIGSSR